MIDAPDAALLDAAEPEIGAPVRTVLVDHADHAATVAEGEQLFAHHDDLFRRPIRVRQFLGKQHRQPESAQQFTHPGSRTAFGQEFVVLRTEHCWSSGLLLLPELGAAQAGRQRGRAGGTGAWVWFARRWSLAPEITIGVGRASGD